MIPNKLKWQWHEPLVLRIRKTSTHQYIALYLSQYWLLLWVIVSKILVFKVSVNNVNKILLVTIECKADSINITEKNYLLQHEQNTASAQLKMIKKAKQELVLQSNAFKLNGVIFISHSYIK